MDKKTLLGVVGLAAFMLIWQYLVVPAIPKELLYKEAPPREETMPLPRDQQIESQQPQNDPSQSPLSSPHAPAGVATSLQEPASLLPEQTYVLENDVLQATFSSKGGALTQLNIKDYHPTINDPNPLDLVRHPSLLINNSRADMQGEVIENDYGKTLTLWNSQVKLIYRLPNQEHFFDLEVHQLQGLPIEITLPEIEHDPSVAKGGVNHGTMGAICNLKQRSYGDNSSAISDDEIAQSAHNFSAPTGELLWTGFRNKYFTLFIEPTKDNVSSHSISFIPKNGRGLLKLTADQGSTLNYKIYAGPLDKGHLYTLDSEKYGPLFNYTGINVIIHFLLWLLDLYNAIPGINMGLAILLLTLTVKTVLFPLNLKAQSSMFMMSNIGPELKALQEKYKNDRQQQGVEQMKLFRENGVNPMAGCLPMLIQMPVMISLFSTVGEGFSLRHAAFVGWIKDLSAPDRFTTVAYDIPFLGNGDGSTNINLLVIFYIVTMLIQQSMMPKSTDPQQQQMQKMMKFMMMGFAFILYNYSSGLMLYFVGSNTLGMLESWYIRNRVIPAMEKKRNKK
jgi:YidC/Oxa1 family membrane protein insertase